VDLKPEELLHRFLCANGRRAEWELYDIQDALHTPIELYHDPALPPCVHRPQPELLSKQLQELGRQTKQELDRKLHRYLKIVGEIDAGRLTTAAEASQRLSGEGLNFVFSPVEDQRSAIRIEAAKLDVLKGPRGRPGKERPMAVAPGLSFRGHTYKYEGPCYDGSNYYTCVVRTCVSGCQGRIAVDPKSLVVLRTLIAHSRPADADKKEEEEEMDCSTSISTRRTRANC
jgi:hypothetical protein